MTDSILEDLKLLKCARKRIESPNNWCKRIYAANERNQPVRPTSREACRFCAYGALMAEAKLNMEVPPAALHLRNAIEHRDIALGIRKVACFNDNRPHSEVLALFDRAIAKLEARV